MRNCLLLLILFIPSLYASDMDSAHQAGVDFGNTNTESLQNTSKNQGAYHYNQPYNSNDIPSYTDSNIKSAAKAMIENPNSSQGQSGEFVISNIKSQEDMKNDHPEISVENNQSLINHSNDIIQQSANNLNDANIYCKDGSCTDTNYTPISDAERNSDLSNVSAVQEAANEETPTAVSNNYNAMINNMQTFKGSAYKCRDMATHYDNCCSDSGWGQKIGLAGCNQEENDLWTKKGQSVCVYVGKYCSHKDLGVCTEHKKSYCCFPTLMARIIQQQGRPQLGWNFGKNDSPSCQGFTPTDLQLIDFSRINFSEFYASLERKMTIPSASSVTKGVSSDKVEARMEDDIKDMFGK